MQALTAQPSQMGVDTGAPGIQLALAVGASVYFLRDTRKLGLGNVPPLHAHHVLKRPRRITTFHEHVLELRKERRIDEWLEAVASLISASSCLLHLCCSVHVTAVHAPYLQHLTHLETVSGLHLICCRVTVQPAGCQQQTYVDWIV